MHFLFLPGGRIKKGMVGPFGFLFFCRFFGTMITGMNLSWRWHLGGHVVFSSRDGEHMGSERGIGGWGYPFMMMITGLFSSFFPFILFLGVASWLQRILGGLVLD